MRECEELGRRPQYLRHNVFRNDELWSRSCAEWTEVARPLPSVPLTEFTNQDATRKIDQNPQLFVGDTPININNFEKLLSRHPNRPFLRSVVNGFRHGFWPWADTRVGEYPYMVDESFGDPRNQRELDFICEQRDKEINMGRFSESFGKNLLPGMYSMPIHAVPKPHSSDLRLGCNTGTGNSAVSQPRVAQVRVRFWNSGPEAVPQPVTAVSRVFAVLSVHCQPKSSCHIIIYILN